MRAEELRIGNSLSHNIYGIVIVKGIEWRSGDHYILTENKGGNLGLFALKSYSGIELSEEWLIKFGFWKREGSNVWNIGTGNYRYCIHQTGMLHPFDVRSSDVFSYFIDTPKYVHQLQNLYYALTGSGLSIKDTV